MTTIKANLDMMEMIVTKVTDKFLESVNLMMKEFSKCIGDAIAGKISALETRLSAIEAKLTPGGISASYEPSSSSPTAVAEVVSKTIIELDRQREEVQLKSMNIIVSGLDPITGTTDKVLFESFCEANLTMKPHVVRTRRLRGPTGSTASPKLCVTLGDPHTVTNIIESASILRHSTNFSRVFINRDLTKAQAEAAFKARAVKRASRSSSHMPIPLDPPPFSS